MNTRWIEVPPIEAKGGRLISWENPATVPFEIRRVFWLDQLDVQSRRGQHANRELEEMLICLRGCCRLLADNGREKEEFILDRSDRGLYIPKMTWVELYAFSQDCLLLALASTHYDEQDSIRDYPAFLQAAGGAR